MSLIPKKVETTYNLLDKNYKILFIFSSVLLVFFIWYSFLSTTLSSLESNKKKAMTMEKEIKVLNEQLTILKNKKTVDKNTELVNEENTLKNNLNDISKKILLYRYQLISYKKIFINLKDIFRQTQGIQLLSIRQSPQELVKDTQSNPVYRYPIELSAKGAFFDILRYLKEIEKFHSYIFWDELTYQVVNYPEGLLKLKFHIITSEAGQDSEVKR